jgi:hypothetical protein
MGRYFYQALGGVLVSTQVLGYLKVRVGRYSRTRVHYTHDPNGSEL